LIKVASGESVCFCGGWGERPDGMARVVDGDEAGDDGLSRLVRLLFSVGVVVALVVVLVVVVGADEGVVGDSVAPALDAITGRVLRENDEVRVVLGSLALISNGLTSSLNLGSKRVKDGKFCNAFES
jgi:hypothetical protein